MTRSFQFKWIILAVALVFLAGPGEAAAKKMKGVDPDIQAALDTLYVKAPAAKVLARQAKGILVFPKVKKAGFIAGAQYGKGALIQNGRTVGYYNIAAASYGLQAGVQSFGYAMFFMTNSALESLNSSAGFEVGTGPSFVLVDKGMAKTLTTTTIREDVYAFIFGQKGLMGGFGLQGSKITRENP